MTVPTLQELIEEYDVRKLHTRILIGGAALPKWTSLDYSFDIGQVPTATIVVPGRSNLPSAVSEEASVEIWVGFTYGMIQLERLVFGGAVVDSVGNNGPDVVIDCVMSGPRKLTYGYNRRINYNFDNVTSEAAVTALLALAGVSNYSVNLDPWVIGTAVPQTLQFSSYGEAINKVAEVDGSPWYAMPTGQVRIEKRDPIPSPTARRTYFSGVLTGPIESQPSEVTNADARPRINDVQRRRFRDQVGNFIHVEGAVLTTIGPNGEQNSEQIVETVDGASGTFPNGAYWIPTPPLFQDFTFNNELIDTNAKAFTVAERYFDLKNRLFEEMPLSVPVDPDVFLGATVQVVDPRYSGVSELYFVKGYRTSISGNSASTELQLTGGEEAGTTGFASPFAEFYWKYTALHRFVGGGIENSSFQDLGPNADQAGKLCEDLPEGSTSNDNQGDSWPAPEDRRTVLIGLDGSPSQDFDGSIVSYTWTWDDSLGVARTLFGERVTIVVDPNLQSSIEMTLTVTDDSGRTDAITKTIYTDADYLNAPGGNDPATNDTENGGGAEAGPCTDDDGAPVPVPGGEGEPVPPNTDGTGRPGACAGLGLGYFIAAGPYAMGTVDNRTWNDLTKVAAGVTGDFISVTSAINYLTQKIYGLFGTTLGEVVLTEDVCVTGSVVLTIPGAPRVECIVVDRTAMANPATGEEWGAEGGPDSGATIPVYTQASPGTMTIEECYQQCLAIGFSAASAVVAVAIMIAESALVSNASNTAGNNPPSTDRGIAQINDYYHPEVSDATAYNTELAIREMFRISSGGNDYSQWATYTQGTYQQHLTDVQNAVDFASYNFPKTFRVWLGTDNGQIWLSENSGRDWSLYKDFGDGLPIQVIITDERLSASTDGYNLAAFGGDTSDVNSLIRLSVDRSGNFFSLQFWGTLGDALATLGGGSKIQAAAINETALMISFSGSLDPVIWLSSDPINTPDSWYAATGFAGAYGFDDVSAAAPGFRGEFLVADGVVTFNTTDNLAFNYKGTGPSTIRHLFWQALPGVYLAAVSNEGLMKSIDGGGGWGHLRGNAEFGTTWPNDAVAYQVAFIVGPRECAANIYLVDKGGGFVPTSFLRLWRLDINTGVWVLVGSAGADIGYFPTHIMVADNIILVQANISTPTVDTRVILRSLDGGTTWIVGDAPAIVLSNNDYQIRDMAVNGNNVVWATVQEGMQDLYVYTSSDYGDTWTQNTIFTDVRSPFSTGQAKITAHPFNPNKIAILYRQDSINNYLLKVTEDSGSNWASYSIGELGLNFNQSSPALEWLPNNRIVIYHEFYDGVALTSVARIGISEDNGATFNYVTIYSDIRQLGFYNTVGFCKTRSNVLFAFAWIDNISGDINPEFFRSLDGGDTWQQFQGVLTEANSVIFTVDEPAGMVYDENTGSLITTFGPGDFDAGQFHVKTIVIPNATSQWTSFSVYEQAGLDIFVGSGGNVSGKVLAQ